ncbi:flagellin [Oscillospiraceae bacterium 50-16]
MRIQHNIMAMNAYRNYNTNTSALSKNLEKLSSGYKINRAGDDAAGLAISEKMRAQITGLNAAQKNVKDGISLVKTAEGAMQEIQDMLNRMDYLATQSANGTYDNEVDRLNLQKEVDALKSEINRIADSANFNGIKLLDGKAGINTSAFSFESAAAVKASNGTVDISKNLSTNDTEAPGLHLETESANAAPAKFTVDLSGLNVKHTGYGAASTAKTDVEITVGGVKTTVQLDAKNAGAKTAIDIGTAFAAEAPNAKKDAADATNNVFKIGNYGFTVTDGTDGTVNFELAGTFNGTTFKSLADAPLTADQAKEVNGLIGSAVTVEVKAAVTTGAGDTNGKVEVTQTNIHNTTKVEQAVAKVDAGLAGIDLKLDANIVKEGNTITIDGQTFKFKTDANSTLSGADVIDVSAGKTDAEKIHLAVDALSKKTVNGQDGRTWKIESKGNDTIHIDQTTATGTGKDPVDTYDKLTGLISVKGQPTTAKAAGVTINVTPDKISAGNQLVIDGKTITFVDGTANTANGEVNKDNLLADLQTALGSNYTVAAEDASNPNKITIRSANTAATSAPVVTGNGLTLQIGDTSDDYNQLNVKIGDMHTSAMGTQGGASIADINIGDQEGAAAAVQTIKDAINYVSGIRGDLGAIQNRLEHTQNNLSVMAENIQDAESTIRDTDVAEEMMSYVKNNILVQSAQAMLAQANQVPQGVLQLLG